MDLKLLILNEQPDRGQTVIEKFESHTGDAGFAIVLLTPDDIAVSKEGLQSRRARQNVIFELGYFVGKLGRRNVCLIEVGEVESFSDYYGVLATPFDAGGGWRFKLAAELKAAGYPIDMNKAV